MRLSKAIPVLLSCSLLWAGSSPNGTAKSVTFTKDAAPIFYKNCVNCHRPGEAAPFSLLNYKESRPWVKSIREKVSQRVMPPWHADSHYGPFRNDRRLNEKEIATIVS